MVQTSKELLRNLGEEEYLQRQQSTDVQVETIVLKGDGHKSTVLDDKI